MSCVLWSFGTTQFYIMLNNEKRHRAGSQTVWCLDLIRLSLNAHRKGCKQKCAATRLHDLG